MAADIGSEVAWYCPSLDESGNGTSKLTDLANSNDGIITGATWEPDTDLGGTRALEFSSDYVAIPNSSDFAFGTDPFWISTWFKLTSTSQQMILDKGYDTGNTTRFFFILLNSTQYRFWAGDATAALTFTASGYENNWVHACLQRNGVNLAAYINGSLAASSSSQPIGQSLTNTDNLSLGARSDNADVFLGGRIDDTRFGTGVLSAGDIARLASRRAYQPPRGEFVRKFIGGIG